MRLTLFAVWCIQHEFILSTYDIQMTPQDTIDDILKQHLPDSELREVNRILYGSGCDERCVLRTVSHIYICQNEILYRKIFFNS